MEDDVNRLFVINLVYYTLFLWTLGTYVDFYEKNNNAIRIVQTWFDVIAI